MKPESNNGHEVTFVLARWWLDFQLVWVYISSNTLTCFKNTQNQGVAELGKYTVVNQGSRDKSAQSKVTILFQVFF